MVYYFLGLSLAKVNIVLFSVPLLERSGVDLDDSAFGQSFGSHKLIV
jgi:hypothetical protein